MGHCGSVWASPDIDTTLQAQGLDVALKREDGGPGRSLSNELSIHVHLVQVLKSMDHDTRAQAFSPLAQTNIPICHGFLRPTDVDKWAHVLPYLPAGYTRCNALLSERIPPMPEIVRQRLIDDFCPKSLQDIIASDKNNNDCIIRPYLGRRRISTPSRNSRFTAFSLRNFPLHADQMEQLGLDLYAYAQAMAEALAFMHWRACIDAKDVEFVLAPCRQPAQDAPALSQGAPFTAGQLGQHAMWIVDFDCCRPITLNQEGVNQAVIAFF